MRTILAGVDVDVPEEQWDAYQALLKMVAEVEERLRGQFAVVEVDPTEEALRAAGLTDEQILVVKTLRGPEPEIAAFEGLTFTPEPLPEAEPIPLTREPRDCPNHRGKIHVPSRYGLLGDTSITGKVIGYCNCGHQFIHLIRCPHQKQTLQGDRNGPVICSWCGSTIIAGTGATGLDDAMKNKQTSLPAVNPDQFNGNA